MEVPNGWTSTALENIIDYKQPTKYIVESTDYRDDYPIPVLTAGKSFIIGYTNETNGIYNEKLPVIIFDDFTTATQFVTFPFKVKSSAMKILQTVNKQLSIKYFFYYMQIIRHNTTTHKRYWISNYSKINIPLAPFAEQRRIVEKIDAFFSELDKGVEYLQTIKQQLNTYRQAVLKWAFEGKLTEISDISFSNRSITEFFDISGGLTKNSNRDKLSLVMPYLRVANVYYNSLDLEEIKTIGVTDAEVERTLLLPNDLLFVEGNGSKEQIGRVASWNGEIEQCLHQNHIIKGRPNGAMMVKYAIYYLMSKTGRDQILTVASSTSGLYTLSISKIKSLILPYCDEQQKVVDAIESRLSVYEKLEQLVDENFIKTEALRQSILKKAFEGRLVQQDPDDEPAEKLLERIKAERAAVQQQKPVKRRKKNG